MNINESIVVISPLPGCVLFLAWPAGGSVPLSGCRVFRRQKPFRMSFNRLSMMQSSSCTAGLRLTAEQGTQDHYCIVYMYTVNPLIMAGAFIY